MSGAGMQKTQKLGLQVPETQGSRKYEGELPSKPGSQSQIWHNTLHPIQKKQVRRKEVEGV